jgi:hypothetical protein
MRTPPAEQSRSLHAAHSHYGIIRCIKRRKRLLCSCLGSFNDFPLSCLCYRVSNGTTIRNDKSERLCKTATYLKTFSIISLQEVRKTTSTSRQKIILVHREPNWGLTTKKQALITQNETFAKKNHISALIMLLRFQVFTAESINIAPCSLVVYQRFRGTSIIMATSHHHSSLWWWRQQELLKR